MSTFSIGNMNQLGDALWKAGFKEDQDITDLKQNTRLLEQLPELMLGTAKVTYLVENGCSQKPANFKVKKKVGLPEHFEWRPDRFIPYVSDSQAAGRLIKVERLCEIVACELLMNADVAHVLWTHQWLIDEIISEESEINKILFVGTVYEDQHKMRCVPCLEKPQRTYFRRPDRPKWVLGYTWLGDFCNKETVVALHSI